jgi:hypothetical protein
VCVVRSGCSKSGFPIRETFERFWRSFRILVPSTRLVLTPAGLMGCPDYGIGCRFAANL